MDESRGETWQFTVSPGAADEVYLVVDGSTTPSRWIKMKRVEAEPGTWTTAADIAPGRARVRYFTAIGTAYLNCGNVGLHGQRTSDFDPAVKLEDLDLVA